MYIPLLPVTQFAHTHIQCSIRMIALNSLFTVFPRTHSHPIFSNLSYTPYFLLFQKKQCSCLTELRIGPFGWLVQKMLAGSWSSYQYVSTYVPNDMAIGKGEYYFLQQEKKERIAFLASVWPVHQYRINYLVSICPPH